MFTLLVNATTMKKLLEKLGMSEISDAKKIAMANAVRQIQESNQRTLNMLKADRFLADADWDIAERDCDVHNPYMEVDDEVRVSLILIITRSILRQPGQPSAYEYEITLK